MTSKSPVRSAEDIDETALSYAEVKALCSGNPAVKEKMDLDVAVAKLKLLKANHLSQIYSLEHDITHRYPRQIKEAEQMIEGYQQDITQRDENTKPNADGFSPMVIQGEAFTEKKAAGSALLEECHNMKSPDPVPWDSTGNLLWNYTQENERKEKQAWLDQINIKLNMDQRGNNLH